MSSSSFALYNRLACVRRQTPWATVFGSNIRVYWSTLNVKQLCCHCFSDNRIVFSSRSSGPVTLRQCIQYIRFAKVDKQVAFTLYLNYRHFISNAKINGLQRFECTSKWSRKVSRRPLEISFKFSRNYGKYYV